MKTITKHTLYVLFSLLPVCRAMPEDASRAVPLELWYDEPAVEWMTSALPLGNGDLGAMFFGGVARERIQFNEKSLWAGSPEKRGTYRISLRPLTESEYDGGVAQAVSSRQEKMHV